MNAEQIAKLKRAIDCLEILDKRPRPMCRDCADEDGTCLTDSLDCDMRKLIADTRAILAERTTSPVSQMTDEQAWEVIKAEQGTQVTDWRGRAAIVIESPSEAGDVVRAILAAVESHAQAPAAQQESIENSNDFCQHLAYYLTVDEYDTGSADKAHRNLIAFIDAHTAAAVEQALLDGYNKGANDVQAISEPIINRTVERAERAEAALAQPVDLSKLTRYDMRSEYNKFACEDQVIPVEDPQGDYVCFADVEQLLAAAPAAPYPTRECAAEALTPSVGAPAAPVADPVPSYAAQLLTGLNDPFSRQPQPVGEQGEKPYAWATPNDWGNEPLVTSLESVVSAWCADGREVTPLYAIAASQQASGPVTYCYYCSEGYSHSCPAHKPASQQPQDELRNAAQLLLDVYDDMRDGRKSTPVFEALRAALAKKGGAANCQNNEGEKA